MTSPNKRLLDILRPAYKPCRGFRGGCKGIARWEPASGHIPRGFTGAFGRLNEVKVVILVAEPGTPRLDETYGDQNQLGQAYAYKFKLLSEGAGKYFRNLKSLLDLLLPNIPLKRQLMRVWITETYLCSAPQSAGYIPKAAEMECASRYLTQQLELFDGLPVIALGDKAYRRAEQAKSDARYLKAAFHPSARKSDEDFKQNYGEAAKWARAFF